MAERERMLRLSKLHQTSGAGVSMVSKRWICRFIGHKYERGRYPDSGDDGGWYLKCKRCQHEKAAKRDERPLRF